MLTFVQAVNEITNAIRRSIQFIDISTQNFISELDARHVPKEIAMLFNELFTEILDGRNSWGADGVQRASLFMVVLLGTTTCSIALIIYSTLHWEKVRQFR